MGLLWRGLAVSGSSYVTWTNYLQFLLQGLHVEPQMGRQLLLHNIKAIHRTADLKTVFPVSPLLTTQIEGPRASLKFLIDLLPNKSRHNKPSLCFGASELQPHCASNLPELCPCKTLQQERHTTKGKDQTHTEYLG